MTITETLDPTLPHVHSPVFQTMFAYNAGFADEDAAAAGATHGGLTKMMESIMIDTGTAKFEVKGLALVCW